MVRDFASTAYSKLALALALALALELELALELGLTVPKPRPRASSEVSRGLGCREGFGLEQATIASSAW